MTIKAESDGGGGSTGSDTRKATSPVELRRKLSLLEEKRAIFQRRLFESTRDDCVGDSGETVIAVTLDEDRDKRYRDIRRSNDEEFELDEDENDSDKVGNGSRKKARHISVRKFDTFSTFEGTFDEDTGLGYLAGIEEDYTESFDRQDEEYVKLQSAVMAPMMAAGNDSIDKARSTSQESAVRVTKI